MNPEDLLYSRVPGRVDLSGSGTDLSPYRETYGGTVVCAALRLYSYATLRPRLDERVIVRYLNDESEFSWESPHHLPVQGPLAVYQSLINRMDLKRGFELILSTDLPPASGLGASASLGIAALAVLKEYTRRHTSRPDLARLYTSAEQDALEHPRRKHDPFICVLGGLRQIDITGDGVAEHELQLKESVRLSFEAGAILAYDASGRTQEETYGDLLSDAEKEATTIHALHRWKTVTQETRTTLIAGDLRSFAIQMNEDWEAHRRLYPACADERVLHLFNVGRTTGARGANLCGLGGGCLLFYCDEPEACLRSQSALRNEGCTILPFQIDDGGARTWSQPQRNS